MLLYTWKILYGFKFAIALRTVAAFKANSIMTDKCQDSSVVSFVRIDPTVSGWNPSPAKL